MDVHAPILDTETEPKLLDFPIPNLCLERKWMKKEASRRGCEGKSNHFYN